MRKHLFGLAIFISIVTAAVVVYGYFSPPIPVIPAVDYPHNEKTFACDHLKREIDYRILTAEVDTRTQAFTARIELKWNGKHEPPDRVYFSLFLWEKGRDPEFWAFTSDVLERPFYSGDKFVTTVVLQKVAGKFRDWNNIYASIDFAEGGKFPSTHQERIAAAELVPVLKVHN